jgi:hypothetical protein
MCVHVSWLLAVFVDKAKKILQPALEGRVECQIYRLFGAPNFMFFYWQNIHIHLF